MLGVTRQMDNTTWTTRKLLSWTSAHLAQKGVDSPKLASEMLLAHVLGVDRIKLYMDLDRPANELERATFRELVRRAAEHEPVEYLVGKCPFFSMMLYVNPAVLIPRPSTETLVEHVIQHSKRTPGFHAPLIADIGTGSGAIAVALAKHIANCRVIATDISSSALEVARQNADALGVSDRIEFRQGDLLEPIEHERVHYLVSNPPYISDDEWKEVPRNVKDYEPESALRGGGDGLRYLRTLIDSSRAVLRTPGQLVLEAAASQKHALIKLAKEAGTWANEHILTDHEHLPRVLVCDTKD
ncbi:MAG: peptide chain release factor N(5)-glutamine methyltransferase [Phycisphaeraceae bacterium]